MEILSHTNSSTVPLLGRHVQEKDIEQAQSDTEQFGIDEVQRLRREWKISVFLSAAFVYLNTFLLLVASDDLDPSGIIGKIISVVASCSFGGVLCGASLLSKYRHNTCILDTDKLARRRYRMPKICTVFGGVLIMIGYGVLAYNALAGNGRSSRQ